MQLVSDQWTPGDVDARVERIVKGLLPAAVVKGQPLPRMTLAERMKFYNVPEISIAFFENGRVTWARAYGLADTTMNKPVTPDTLFQAASISKSITAFAALRLVQQGKLSLDEDVNLDSDHLHPYFFERSPEI